MKTTTQAGPTVEVVGGREFTVEPYPHTWDAHTFAGKVFWLQRHTTPRCTYSQACAILSAHAAARRAKERETRARAEQELAEKQASGSPVLSVDEAGRQLVHFGHKWCGYTLTEIVAKDPGYLDWMSRQDWIRGTLREAVLVLCHHHREAIAAARRR